ncbi:Eco57I restriction-modification methylase domain-containing protein [uncultured Treponema sp.]|uniref:Eco57I restriction-modification methylase domain-containing protein n=2 Tax=uncultured Treponema sp. TaxID=162155 RepID=UPI0025DCB607|nr:Eco57I restriction-modification methylase domain-containing protein [uncultured Treponema sp.]
MKTFDVSKEYNRENFSEFLTDFLPDDFEQAEEETFFEYTNIEEGYKLGTSESLNLDVFEFRTKGDHDPRVTLTKEVISCMKKYGFNQNVLAVFYSPKSHTWRLSLITSDYEFVNGKIKPLYSNPKRFSFKLGEGCKKHTPESMLSKKVTSFEDLKKRFDIEVVTKEFYQELFSWYTWACDLSTYPQGKGNSVKQTSKNNKTNLIRLITRLMFVWFIKQKDLIPSWIFDEMELKGILSDFDSQSTEKGNYYNAVIKNLFFATLNKAIAERGFTDDDKAYLQYGIKTLYRDDNKKSFFKASHEEIIRLFSSVPFLNGGLFECLDKLEASENGNNIQIYNDGFSRESSRRAFIPNALFFQKEKDGHEGIIHILNRYNFTVEENSPSDVQVALDPELLGKVFENLLGTYNPETSETARKDSGSFYTPREIVNFMVDESIKNYLENSIKISIEQINQLFDDNTSEVKFKNNNEIINLLMNIKVLDPACGSGAFPVGILQRLVSLIRKLDSSYNSKQSIYELKLHLIENCIFGSDIQTIAVQIAKLRFFITLICEQEKGNDAKNNYGFDPLPNLETKFVAANSLIEISKKEENMALQLFDNGVSQTREELKNIRAKHFSSQTAKEKMHYRTLDKECRERLAKLLEQDRLYDNEDAKQLASWNPYDQNAVADFFDANWMFGIEDGFDIVIGNPPYIQLQNNSGKLAKLYENQNYKAFAKTGDIYCLFYECGFNLLKDNGHLCFITSNKWMRAGYGEKLRDFFAKNVNPKELIDFAGVKVFESATVDTNILLFQKAQNKKQTLACVTKNMKYDDLGNLSHFIQQNSSACAFDSPASWVILSPVEQSIKRKIESAGVPLKDWDINIYRGVLTGYNDAFIISGAKRDEILAECNTEEERRRTDELIRPVLRGRDIKRYGYEFADLYLIATFPSRHYNIEEYPAVKKYLLSFEIERLEQTGKEYIVNGEKIKARKKTNNKWFETQDSISYWDDFFKPKIVWSRLMRLSKNDINNFPRFCFTSGDYFVVDSLCFFSGSNVEVLVNELNSEFAAWYFFNNVAVLDNGGFQMRQQYVENIPLPKLTKGVTKKTVDEKIYEAFGFSSKEIDFIREAIKHKQQEVLNIIK